MVDESLSQPGRGEESGGTTGPASARSAPNANRRSTANAARASSPTSAADSSALHHPPEAVTKGLLARRSTELMQIVLDDVPAAPGEVFVRKQGALLAESVAAGDLQLLGFRSMEST